jgi:hypothetical protein
MEWKLKGDSSTFLQDQRKALDEYEQNVPKSSVLKPLVPVPPSALSPGPSASIPLPRAAFSPASRSALSPGNKTSAPNSPRPGRVTIRIPALKSRVGTAASPALNTMDIDPLSEPALLESAGKHEESKHDTSYDEESSDEVPIAKTIATSSKLSPHRARTEKDRRDPRATGALHEIPCRACAKKGVACQKEVRGRACVTCYKWKKRCTHSGAVREKRRK